MFLLEFRIRYVVPFRHIEVCDVFCLRENRLMMWTSYGAAEVGVATAKSPCGPYSYQSSFKPLGADSRDMSLFQDGEVIFITVLTTEIAQQMPHSYLDR